MAVRIKSCFPCNQHYPMVRRQVGEFCLLEVRLYGMGYPPTLNFAGVCAGLGPRSREKVRRDLIPLSPSATVTTMDDCPLPQFDYAMFPPKCSLAIACPPTAPAEVPESAPMSAVD